MSIGWNCYPGWLLRDIFSQPAYPWDWMQFFTADCLSKMLTPGGIHEVARSFEIKNVVNDTEMTQDKPHFWSDCWKIRSPHDHEKEPFLSLDDSRLKIEEKINRRLERLKCIARRKGNQVVFLGSHNSGDYGIMGYESKTYAADMATFMRMANEALQPSQPLTLLLCSPSAIPINADLGAQVEGIVSIDDISNGYFLKSRFWYEDAYYQKSANSNREEVLRYWEEHLRDASGKLGK